MFDIKKGICYFLPNFVSYFFRGRSFSEQYCAVRMRHRENINIWGESYDDSAFGSFEFFKIDAKMNILLANW